MAALRPLLRLAASDLGQFVHDLNRKKLVALRVRELGRQVQMIGRRRQLIPTRVQAPELKMKERGQIGPLPYSAMQQLFAPGQVTPIQERIEFFN